MNKHDIVVKSHCVFCKRKQCLMNTLEFFEEINKQVDEGDLV